MERRKKKKGAAGVFLLLLLVIVLACLGILYTLSLYSSALRQQAEADAALQRSEMENSLRSASAQASEKLRERQEQEVREAEELRLSLKNSFLARDREELLLLVNPWNAVPEDYTPRLVDLGDGIWIDERAAGDLTAMLEACYADPHGSIPVPISGYRTQEYQQGLYDDKIRRLREAGWSEEDAPAEAAHSVAVPGTSEHQLGLAIDILDVNNSELDLTQSWTETQRWLSAHCAEYGFILRYPDGTSDITGIIFEPWHYRYVGKELAQKITASGLTLEEYLAQETE